MATTSKVDTDKPHRRTGSVLSIERYSYQCDNCRTKFNWDANCRHGGTYRDLDEGKRVETFCCAGCKATWTKNQSAKLQK